MRLTHTVWTRSKGPLDIVLNSNVDDEGNTHYIITEQQTGEERRMLSQEETGQLQALLE